MAPREAIIRTEEVGGSPEGAQKLVKTHENIEKSIKQQVHDAIYLIIVFSLGTLRPVSSQENKHGIGPDRNKIEHAHRLSVPISCSSLNL